MFEMMAKRFEKKDILARLRKLGEEMKPTASSSSNSSITKGVTNSSSDDHEQRERERLDKELDLHSAVQAVEGDEESTESLKERLAKLKAEVRNLCRLKRTYSYTFDGRLRALE